MRLRELAIAHDQRGRGGLVKEKEGLLYAAAAGAVLLPANASRRRWHEKKGGGKICIITEKRYSIVLLYWKGAVEGHSMTATAVIPAVPVAAFQHITGSLASPTWPPPLVGFLNSRQGIRRRRRRRRVPKQKAVTPHILSFPRSRLPG